MRAGALHAGAMLVVACHLEGCAICRRESGLVGKRRRRAAGMIIPG